MRWVERGAVCGNELAIVETGMRCIALRTGCSDNDYVLLCMGDVANAILSREVAHRCGSQRQ